METLIYDCFIESKTGLQIPLLKSGRTVESRYDPQKEALKQCSQIKQETHFVIISGIAGGILIKTILENRPDIFIIAVENTCAEIEFLKQSSIVKSFENSFNICLCTIDQLEQIINQYYVPAFYGNLEVLEQKAWLQENTQLKEKLFNIIRHAISVVSADFSVQSHFGKLWQHNIMSNVQFIKNTNPDILPSKQELKKTAVVLAAGPTIDSTVQRLIKNPDQYYIIATDTAFSILADHGLKADAVVSLDGQNISGTHFIHNSFYDKTKTIFIFDLSANSSAVKKVISQNAAVLFFKSGHPFCEYICKKYKIELPYLYSGSGTVTISAVDFALKCGFEKILVFGADFGFSKGKPYAKGTYLDRLYKTCNTRFFTDEKQFTNLMYRTKTFTSGKRITTQILEAYKKSFEEYLLNSGLSFIYENDCYEIVNTKTAETENSVLYNNTSLKITSEVLAQDILRDGKNRFFTDFSSLSFKDISLLPLISWLRYHDNKKEADFKYFYNLALKYFERYL